VIRSRIGIPIPIGTSVAGPLRHWGHSTEHPPTIELDDHWAVRILHGRLPARSDKAVPEM
jgi:hypothetical protein